MKQLKSLTFTFGNNISTIAIYNITNSNILIDLRINKFTAKY